MSNIVVSPSILSANFTQIKSAIDELTSCKADWIHCDVMDGVFVPNLTFGQKMVKDIKQITNLVLDVHLMIVDPIKYVEEFANAGADYITVHFEACSNILETIKAIKKTGKKVGLSIKPQTEVSTIKPYINELDMVLVMSVEPGFGGQKFMPNALEKIKYIRSLNKHILIEVDGGINEDNVDDVINAGANVIVAGSSVFNAIDKAAAILRLRGIK